MYRASIAAAFILFLVAVGIAAAPQEPNADAEILFSADKHEIPPTKRKKLLKWLRNGEYLDSFIPEPEVHPSNGPHGGNVRTYYNGILFQDLRDGRASFRKGATMVKELYFNGTDEVLGYAVMTKVKKKSGSNGQGWVWLESFDAGQSAGFYGRGLSACAGCHSAGTDFLLSTFRP